MEQLNNTENTKKTKKGKKDSEGEEKLLVTLDFKNDRSSYDLLRDYFEKCNDREVGKKISRVDIVSYALKLLTEVDVKKMQDETLSKKERFQLMFLDFKEKGNGIEEDEFYDMAIKAMEKKIPKNLVQ